MITPFRKPSLHDHLQPGLSPHQAYMSYYDSSAATASGRKFKYVSVSGVDDTLFRKNKGYWLYANQSGNLTLPGVGGTLAGATFNWSGLNFTNSSGVELEITSAESAGWIDSDLQYWDENIWQFKHIHLLGDKTIISPWEGVYIWSNEDNITLIRRG